MEFFATCPYNFEEALAAELRACKVHRVRPLRGGVSFGNALEDAYRACIYSRLASRILLVLGRFPAQNQDELYRSIYTIPWEEHMAATSTFVIDAHGTNEALRNTQFVAQKAKDALVDRMRDKKGSRPNIDLNAPDIRINIRINKERAIISIDLSGEPLHKRGYREAGKQSEAPLRENLAAFILSKGAWFRYARKDELCFIDPMCGSGTLAIEAALEALDRAPGLTRSTWGFTHWLGHEQEIFETILDEADLKAEQAAHKKLHIYASDIDPQAIELAKANALRAGVSKYIEFRVQDISELELKPALSQGLLATNPPYGERMMHAAQLPVLYAALDTFLSKEELKDFRAVIISSDEALDRSIRRRLEKSFEVKNGPLDARVWCFDTRDEEANTQMSELSTKQGQTIAVRQEASEQFLKRLEKVSKERKKWAQKNAIAAYRIYDADLPDYNLAIDNYEGAGPDEGKRLIQMFEYQAPKHIEQELAQTRLYDALAIVPEVLSVEPDKIFLKTRKRGRGGSQYGREKSKPANLITQEGGLLIQVNLSQYLDTGLFIDHRLTRELVRSRVADKRFLNLFSYTSTVSLFAADGGSYETTSVDLSHTYLQWAQKNFKLNKMDDEKKHHFIEANVLTWIKEMRHSKYRWDFIFCDPPTFSNSKSMGSQDFDVQRDHVELLINTSRLLSRGGEGIFSCNLRSFKPDYEALEKAGVELTDISAKTIPHDFERNPKIHVAYTFRRL
ncbi:MAG: bifunctional 23S rRNA (guanine(2069)-N(7))-methyltransferase RlmK/23S rRNA (guanine(2445)-N(2))-methyltransferase RlmL [Coriobacteriia bacterium]|nr:bifunctional 23S rRNA (guanine(2069)-N(7))-methyltransferase RlmK/23S rRNA (guanine(2445)-N(2))-methyltransferase RlmL [Coriobacteriia bacterium]